MAKGARAAPQRWQPPGQDVVAATTAPGLAPSAPSGLTSLFPAGVPLPEVQAAGWERCPGAAPWGPAWRMLSAHAWAQRLGICLLNSIRGVKGLDPDPLWELGLARGHCGNKMI